MHTTSGQEPSKESREPILVLEHIRAGYGNRTVIHDVCLHVDPNQIVVLLGDNGTGKSTILKVIIGLLQVLEGRVMFGSQCIAGLPPHVIQKMGIGYLFQGGRIFANLTVGQNIEMATRRAQPGKVSCSSFQDQLLFARLRDQWNMRAGLLSGGDRKALAFQMVWIQKPLFLLLDEPTAGLAPDLASKVVEYVTAFAATGNRAVLLIEQNGGIVKSISDQCLTLRDGKIAADPDLT